jgi:hypothetical protein
LSMPWWWCVDVSIFFLIKYLIFISIFFSILDFENSFLGF